MSEPAVLDPGDARPGPRASLRAWLALQHALALEPERAVTSLRAGADPRAVLRRARAPVDERAVEASLRALARCGVRALPWASPAYPPQLAALADPPPLLLVRGDPAALSRIGVALVGARAATAYGLSAARGLAADLARAGLVIVSGLARGIDAAAHRGALEAGGVTVAVLACGPDRVYPPEHRALAREIAATGAVVSELPPGSEPRAAFFPLRNRLISGLAEAVIVVEARLRSGSLITARHALDQGLEVLAVPGPIDAPTSEGPNRLLRDGASPVLEAADVLDALAHGAAGRRVRSRGAPRDAGADPLLDALRREPATRDELLARTRLPVEQLTLALLELELAGRIVEDRDGRLRVR